MINDVLKDFLDHFVYVYLDDILIYSPDLDTHNKHVTAVLQRLLENKLYVKAVTISFLGFIVAPGKNQMDPAKVRAVTEWPTPDSRKKVQQFLRFTNFYRQFIRGFSATAAPSHALTSSKVQFVGSPETDPPLTTVPILRMPDPPTPVRCGGGCLQGRNRGSTVPGRRVSWKDAFLRLPIADRELLAVKVALEEWRHWLDGTQHPFIVWADHKNLEYIRKAKRLHPRQARWALFFNRFSFSLSVYRPGSVGKRRFHILRDGWQPKPAP